MGSRARKTKVIILIDEDDRISRLPDELIHKILSFIDAKEAVQTSVLSRRWKQLWTTLPSFSFGEYKNSTSQNISKFIRHVLSKRNRQSNLSELKYCVYNKGHRGRVIPFFLKYAMSQNLQSLEFHLSYKHKPYKLSTFSSKSLTKLTLGVKFEEFDLQLDCWDLPALTTLHLKYPTFEKNINISNSWFSCLPALRTLGLDNWDLSVSSFSFSFPNLTTLRLCKCILPDNKVWDLPALISLALYDLYYPYDMSGMLSTLTNLQNFTISSAFSRNHFISCPRQLVNLYIRTSSSRNEYKSGNIVVLAPKILSFTSFGIFTATFGVPELENVNIRLRGWVQGTENSEEKFYHRLTNMLAGLGNAKNLTFDIESLEALNKISSLLVSLPSPFCNLNRVKLPRGYKESNMSSALKSYLLGGSPRATIFTTLPQNTLNYQEVPHCLTSQKLMLDGALATNVNDRASSSRGHSDIGLWRGHEVKSDFVGLLDLIMTKYPETFEHFTAKSEKFNTLKLNMLCTSVNEFLRTSLTEFNTDIITEYKDLFTDLQRWGFNVNWLVSHLEYIECLQISQNELHSIESLTNDAKNKLQDLQSHCLEKINRD